MTGRQKQLMRYGLLVTAIAIGVGMPMVSGRANGGRTAPAPASPQSQRAGDIDAELITILARGFEPAEINRPAGRFVLAIDDRSGLEEVVLRLERQDGQANDGFRTRRNQSEIRKVVDLPPGVYLLREARHPDWVCRITIREP